MLKEASASNQNVTKLVPSQDAITKPMKVLVVDNGTHYKKRLTNLLKGFDVTRISHTEINPKTHAVGFDLILLSGAYGKESIKTSADTHYRDEQALIRSAKVPVIGLCYAAQLIAYMYGAKLSTVPEDGRRIKGLKRIWNVKKTPFDFFPYYGGWVWASQRWRITELPDALECWCASNEGVEVFKHKKKPIYGLQFHPERRAENNHGSQILGKILEIEFGKKHL